MSNIIICPNHEYQVPFISTMAFMGAEKWCPYCGHTTGIFHDGKEVDATPELIKRQVDYREVSKDFIHAKGVTHCSLTTWKGNAILPDQLPQEEKDRLAQIRGEWKYNIKIEETV